MKQRITAAELMARLTADPEYVARKKEREEKIQQKSEVYARAEVPVVEELREAGVQVPSVWDLVNAPNRYPQSLPILLAHLQREYPDAVRDGIARAMAVPDAKFAWSVLVELYRKLPSNRTKQGLAVALSNTADDELIGELIDLAREPQNGTSRILLLDALRRSRLPLAREALTDFSTDELLQNEARQILRRLRSLRK